MPKINCNIIRDLLPSYLDGLCSTESSELLETHFKECENCKKIYEQSKLDFLPTNISSSKEVDYFKKIRANVSRKNTFILIIILLLFVLLFYCNQNPYLYPYSHSFTMYLNYAFPLITAGLLFAVLPDHAEHSVPNKLKFSVLGIEFASITYILVLTLYMTNSFINGQIPFGLSAEKIGPLLRIQQYGVLTGLLIAFLATLFFSIRKKAICPALHFLPLGGIAFMFEYIRILQGLSSHINYSMFFVPYIIFTCETIILVGFYLFANRYK